MCRKELAASRAVSMGSSRDIWRVLEWMCVSMSLSCIRLFATPWTAARQASLSMEFSREEYSSELPFPTPGALPNPWIEPTSPVSPALAGGFFTTAPPGKPKYIKSDFFLGYFMSTIYINKTSNIKYLFKNVIH